MDSFSLFQSAVTLVVLFLACVFAAFFIACREKVDAKRLWTLSFALMFSVAGVIALAVPELLAAFSLRFGSQGIRAGAPFLFLRFTVVTRRSFLRSRTYAKGRSRK
jgi:hypothetical protein